jgi:hypothetical protein
MTVPIVVSCAGRAMADDGPRPQVFIQSENEIHFVPPGITDDSDVVQKYTIYTIDSNNKQTVFDKLKEQAADRPILFAPSPGVSDSRLAELIALFADEKYDVQFKDAYTEPDEFLFADADSPIDPQFFEIRAELDHMAELFEQKLAEYRAQPGKPIDSPEQESISKRETETNLEEALHKRLSELFDRRQEQQLDEVVQQMQKLATLKQRIEERASKKDAIIAERVEAILSGDDKDLVPTTNKHSGSTEMRLLENDREMAMHEIRLIEAELNTMLDANKRVSNTVSITEIRKAESKLAQAKLSLERAEILLHDKQREPVKSTESRIRNNELEVAKLNLERAVNQLRIYRSAGKGAPQLKLQEAEYQVQRAKLELQRAEILAEASEKSMSSNVGDNPYSMRTIDEYRLLQAEYERGVNELRRIEADVNAHISRNKNSVADDAVRDLLKKRESSLRSQYGKQQVAVSEIQARINDMKAHYETAVARQREETTNQQQEQFRLLQNELQQAEALVEQQAKLWKICKTQYESGTGSQSDLIEAETKHKLSKLQVERIQMQIDAITQPGNRPAAVK